MFVQMQVAHASHGPLPGQLLLHPAGGENTWALPNLLQNRVHKAGNKPCVQSDCGNTHSGLKQIWEQPALAWTELWGTGSEEDKHFFEAKVTTK